MLVIGPHPAVVRPGPSHPAGSNRRRDGERAVRGHRQTGTESHVDTDAGPAGPERGHRTVLGQQADRRAEPEQDKPQR